MSEYSSTELMICVAARQMEDNTTAFIGTGVPMLAASLGLLACGHPHIAGPLLEKYPLLGAIDLAEQRSTVALFALSDQYTELRRRLGVTLSMPNALAE